MIYVFEDNKKDPLPQLFMKSYCSEISSNFIYTEGNGNVYHKVESLLSSNDKILVYLDTIPGNDSTRKIYYKLSSLSRKNNNQIIVLPILGLEYYFIKSIQYENVITSEVDVNRCVNRKAYFTSNLLSNQKEKDYCKYYERYCKLILMKGVIDCIRNTEDNGKNKYFRRYYKEDCKCRDFLESCKDKSIKEKSTCFLKAFPCVPRGSKIQNMKRLEIDEIWKIHRALVDEHNKLCIELKENEPNETRKNIYKEIKSIC